MEIRQLADELNAYCQDTTLLIEQNLAQRTHALTLIGLIQRIARTRRHLPEIWSLLQQATDLRQRLEEVNQQLFQRFRTEIRQGYSRGATLAEQLRQFTPPLVAEPTTRYFTPDALDVLISGILELEKGPTVNQMLEPGMIHYESTPARAILALTQRVRFAPHQVFYDLGSGLGAVAILVHLLTGVPCKGVEIETDFCRYARQQLAHLNLTGVTILNVDARTVNYRDGDIFFMFTPFYGEVLQNVLDLLHSQAQQHPITLCTYGPCTPIVAQQPWLSPTNGATNDVFELAIFATR